MNFQPQISVLVIEDSEADSRLVIETLVIDLTVAYSVESASTLAEGIRMLKGGRFDVVLMDLGLPDYSGLETVRHFRREAPEVPLVILTGYDDRETALAALREGAQDYLPKNLLSPDSLSRIIMYAVERKKIEALLRRQEILLSSVSEAIISFDHNLRITWFNRASEQMFGKSLESAAGNPVGDIWKVPESIQSFEGLVGILRKNGTWNGEIHGKREDGTFLPLLTSISEIKGQYGDVTGYVAASRDITEMKKFEEELRQKAVEMRELSLRDELTGIFNRRGFMTLAEQQLKLAVRNTNELAIVYLDLDNMKSINDQLGHKTGDQALYDSANLIKKSSRESDITARLGGDEFTVMLVSKNNVESSRLYVTRLEQNINDFNSSSGRPFKLQMSTGIALFDSGNPEDLADLLIRADKAMYTVKQKKKGR